MNKGTHDCLYNCGEACTGECIKPDTNNQQTLDLILEEIKSLKDRIVVLEKEMKNKAPRQVVYGGEGSRRR